MTKGELTLHDKPQFELDDAKSGTLSDYQIQVHEFGFSGHAPDCPRAHDAPVPRLCVVWPDGAYFTMTRDIAVSLRDGIDAMLSQVWPEQPIEI